MTKVPVETRPSISQSNGGGHFWGPAAEKMESGRVFDPADTRRCTVTITLATFWDFVSFGSHFLLIMNRS